MRYFLVSSVALLVIVLDQLSKWLIMLRIPEYKVITLIPGFFDLVNIRNRGAAFGFLNRSDIEWQFWLFLGATLVATVAIALLVRSARHNTLLFIAFGLVLGGALGNLIDRVRFRAVVDFLDFYIGQWHWPAFNVADIAICIGAFFICIFMYKEDKQRISAAKRYV